MPHYHRITGFDPRIDFGAGTRVSILADTHFGGGYCRREINIGDTIQRDGDDDSFSRVSLPTLGCHADTGFLLLDRSDRGVQLEFCLAVCMNCIDEFLCPALDSIPAQVVP